MSLSNQKGSVSMEHVLLVSAVALVLFASLGTFVDRMDDYYSNFSEQTIDVNK